MRQFSRSQARTCRQSEFYDRFRFRSYLLESYHPRGDSDRTLVTIQIMHVAIRNPYDYQVLGLTVNATDEEIRAAYKKLALQWHPDRHLTAKEHAAHMFVEVNRAYHSLIAGIESMHSSRGDSSSPAYAQTETGTVRSSSPNSTPQATQSPRRSASPGLRTNEHSVPIFPSSVRGSNSARSSQSRSSDSKTHDYHSSPRLHSTKSSSAGSSGSSRTSRVPTSKSHDNLRHPPQLSSPGRASPLSADRFSRTSVHLSHSRSHDSLRDCPRNLHESGQVHPLTAYDPRLQASNRPKNNHATQETEPTYTYNHHKGSSHGFRDAKSLRSRAGRFSPVIPPTASKLHKRSPLGLGEEILYKLSKVSSKVKKDGSLTPSDNTLSYGSPLRALGTPRGASKSKDWFFPLPLTLDEMFHGAAYRFLVTRELLSRKTEQVEILIEVPPGTRSGTRIVCPRTGHQCKDGTLQDVIFLVEEIPQGQFLRVKDDLFMDICVPWMEALAEHGADICIDGMDGDQITFALPYPIYDKSTEGEVIVKGAGMPIRQGRKTVGRGDLIVRWQVVFSSPSKWKTFKKVLRIKV